MQAAVIPAPPKLFLIFIGNEYLVLWEGFPKEDASWVEEKDLTEAAVKYTECTKLYTECL